MTDFGDGLRPVCRRCDELADVLVARRATPKAPWFPYCDAHDPDPEEYGNQTAWGEKITIRRYDETPPDYTVFGRPGSESHRGQIIHVETPAADGVLCDFDVSESRRFNLSVAQPEGSALCRSCTSQHQWRENYSDDVVAGYLLELRDILDRRGELRHGVDRFIEFPSPDPKTNHMIAEGVRDV